jgi:hypothetical protein
MEGDDAPSTQPAPDDSSPVNVFGPRLPAAESPGGTEAPPAGSRSVNDASNPDLTGWNTTPDVTRPAPTAAQGVGSPRNCGSQGSG